MSNKLLTPSNTEVEYQELAKSCQHGLAIYDRDANSNSWRLYSVCPKHVLEADDFEADDSIVARMYEYGMAIMNITAPLPVPDVIVDEAKRGLNDVLAEIATCEDQQRFEELQAEVKALMPDAEVRIIGAPAQRKAKPKEAEDEPITSPFEAVVRHLDEETRKDFINWSMDVMGEDNINNDKLRAAHLVATSTRKEPVSELIQQCKNLGIDNLMGAGRWAANVIFEDNPHKMTMRVAKYVRAVCSGLALAGVLDSQTMSDLFRPSVEAEFERKGGLGNVLAELVQKLAGKPEKPEGMSHLANMARTTPMPIVKELRDWLKSFGNLPTQGTLQYDAWQMVSLFVDGIEHDNVELRMTTIRNAQMVSAATWAQGQLSTNPSSAARLAGKCVRAILSSLALDGNENAKEAMERFT